MILTVGALLFTGCETDKKLDKIAENLEGLVTVKKGVSCEDKGVLEVLKRIVDKKFDADFKIEEENIVIWDYNSVGRYTCRAKIKKVGEHKNKTASSTDKDVAMLAVLTQMYAPAQFGITAEGGWINYYTYVTTASSKEDRHLYVEIFTEKSGE